MAARLCHLPKYITQNQAWYQAVRIAKVCGNVFIVIVYTHTNTHTHACYLHIGLTVFVVHPS